MNTEVAQSWCAHLRPNAHVVVGLSGGVDSSVAALNLVQAGFSVSAIFMQNWEDDDEACTARQDYRDAAGVAETLGIPLSTVNFADEYWERVFAHFLREYQAGRTPNPDILCNQEIKFKAFLDHALHLGADAIATGHYAQLAHEPSGTRLLRGFDNNKDQTYFLHTLAQAQLQRALFPVGHMDKSVVRTVAQNAGLHVHGKKDSTGICFIGERRFANFLAEYLPAQPGNMMTDTGELIGHHTGLMFYTLGQRQGLGIGGQHGKKDEPWFVLAKQLSTNTLNHPWLFSDNCEGHLTHWVAGHAPARRFSCVAKTRYRQADQEASVETLSDDRVRIQFKEPVRAITPGQSVVLYDGESCLGGAVISDFAKEVPGEIPTN